LSKPSSDQGYSKYFKPNTASQGFDCLFSVFPGTILIIFFKLSYELLMTVINNQKRILREKTLTLNFQLEKKNSSALIRQIFLVNQTCHSIHGSVNYIYGNSPFNQFMSLPLSSGLRMCGILCKRKLVVWNVGSIYHLDHQSVILDKIYKPFLNSTPG